MAIKSIGLGQDAESQWLQVKSEQATSLQKKLQTTDPEKAKKAAKDFEAMMIKTTLKSMTDTVENGSFFGDAPGSDFYQDIYLQHIAELMSQKNNMGLASMIEKQVLKQGQTTKTQTPKKMVSIPKYKAPDVALYTKTETDATQVTQKEKATSSNESTKPKTLLARLSNFDNIIEKASNTFSVDKKLIQAVIAQESYSNPKAISKSGAKGMMQLMDSTATFLGVKNSLDPEENIMAGTKYLKMLINRYQDTETALAAYNAGPGNVDKYDGIPPFKETQNYVRKVMQFYENM